MPKEKVLFFKEVLESVVNEMVDNENLLFLKDIKLSIVIYTKVVKRLSIFIAFMNVADMSYFPYSVILFVALLLWDEITCLVTLYYFQE